MRIRCEVPFCSHTRGDWKNDPVTDGMEWICREHWMALPPRQRRVYRRARKRHDQADPVVARLWRRLKAAAIERAAGI